MSDKYKDGYYVISENKESMNPFHWVLKAPNHEIILSASGHHKLEKDAVAEIKLVQNNCKTDSNYNQLIAKDASPYFTFSVSNDILGNSEMYESTGARDNGIASCQKNGSTKIILDENLEFIAGDSSDNSDAVINQEPEISTKDTRYA